MDGGLSFNIDSYAMINSYAIRLNKPGGIIDYRNYKICFA